MKRYTLTGLIFLLSITRFLLAQDLTVKIDPAESKLQEGETCTLDVYIQNVSGLGAFEFEITFDTDIVHADASLLGDFLGSTGRTVLPLSPVLDNTSNPGSVRHGAATLGATPAGPSGSGILARVVFTAQGIGTTGLVFENAQVTDITGSAFTIDQLTDGSIEVEGEGGTPVWETQGSGTASRLNRVHAVSDRNVWTVGNNIMLRTTNGGSGWTDVTGSLGTLTFMSLWAFDQNKALVGGYIPSAGHSKIYRTTNGGSSWSLVYEVDQHWQNIIFMKDQNNGYFLGDAVGQTWVFMKTTDGGLNWSSVATAPASHENNEYTFGGSAYWWDGNNKIFFVSGAGWFYSSTNLGASWTSVSVLDSPQLSSVAFNGTGTTGLAGTGSTGRLARSTNSGASWSEITAPASGTIYTIEYDDGKFWILIGTKVYTSQDAGENWDLETTASASLLDIDFVTAAGGVYGWAVGNSGQIVYYSPTSVSFGETITQSVPDECMLCQNYPNPFNPVTTISYGLVDPARVTIAIYDILGQHLETLVDEMKPAGYYRVDWNASGRASGIYFCQMKAEGKRSMIKLLLTK